ncbi:MAG: inositol monophosphatase family protein [Candidatus Thiodiazotropha sp.]
MHPILKTAVDAAIKAGNLILQYADKTSLINVKNKSPSDVVSEVDHIAEEIIIRIIQNKYPHHSILSEECGWAREEADFVWVIDPLDGTTNFLKGIPHYAVSIAIKHQDQLQHGVVYNPAQDELYTASLGEGATLNKRSINISSSHVSGKALLVTGISSCSDFNIGQYLGTMKNILESSSVLGIRQSGAASLDLAYIATGRHDGFWQFGLKEWDIAAGALLVQEAGGYVCDINGGSSYLHTGNILAANPFIYDLILSYLQASID